MNEEERMADKELLALSILRTWLYRWEESQCDLDCMLTGCDFQTDRPKYGGSGFVTLEMYLHLMTHSVDELATFDG